jgi:hypothetical protein
MGAPKRYSLDLANSGAKKGLGNKIIDKNLLFFINFFMVHAIKSLVPTQPNR